jgi:ABC-2 type transport system ATP-binding protein
MMNNSVVAVSDLRVVRGGRTILDGIDADVVQGQITGLIGPSGCGKTTMIRTVMGLQRYVGGSVDILGHRPGHRSLRGQIGYVTQSPSVYGNLTVSENLRFFAAVLGCDREDVQRVVEQVGLAEDENSVVDRLSGGQRSRVSLAVALLGDPRLLILDEPTVGLDPVLRKDLWALFRRLTDTGVGMLVSSHVMDEAGRCDTLILMREGRVIASDRPQHLLDETHADDLENAFLALVEHDQSPSKPVPQSGASA